MPNLSLLQLVLNNIQMNGNESQPIKLCSATLILRFSVSLTNQSGKLVIIFLISEFETSHVSKKQFISELLLDLKIRWRRRQWEHQKSNRCNKHVRHTFFVHFLAVSARLRRKNAKFPFYGGRKQATTKFFFSSENKNLFKNLNSLNLC